MPTHLKFYRGCIPTKPGSTVESVKQAKEQFNRYRKRWADRKANEDRTLEYLMKQHVTAPDTLEFDFLLYTDSEDTEFEEWFRHAAEQAGFERPNIQPLRPKKPGDSIIGQAHCVEKNLTKTRFCRRRIWVPAKNGLHRRWNTRNFWQRRTVAELYRECRVEWFGSEPVAEYDAEMRHDFPVRLRFDVREQFSAPWYVRQEPAFVTLAERLRQRDLRFMLDEDRERIELVARRMFRRHASSPKRVRRLRCHRWDQVTEYPRDGLHLLDAAISVVTSKRFDAWQAE